MSAQTPETGETVSNEEAQPQTNNSDSEKTLVADATHQYGADDEVVEQINTNIAICELVEDIVESEGGLDYNSGPYRVAQEVGAEAEHVRAVIDKHFKVENGSVQDRKEDVDTTGGGSSNSVASWEVIRDMFGGENKKEGRFLAVQRLQTEHDWMYLKDESNGLDDFRYYDKDDGVYVSDADGRLSTLVELNLKQHASSHEEREIKRALKARNRVEFKEVNAGDEPLLCVENGVLNIETWELKEHSPEYYFVQKLNAPWDSYADTSEVEAFIRDITACEEDAHVIEEMFGDCLTRDYKRQWFGIFHGPGANGKSALLRCLREVLNPKNVSSESLHDIADTRWSGARIAGGYGAMANIDPDIEARKIKEAASIKNLTGGDATSMEYKGGDKFEAVNTAKMLFAVNTPPIFEEKVNAIVRRIKPVELPYRYKPEDEVDPSDPLEKPRDPDIEEKLTTRENRAAWLKVMALGLERLRALDGFSYSQSQEELFDHYQGNADTFWSFQRDCLQNLRAQYTDNGAAVYLTLDEIHSMYSSYASERDETPMAKDSMRRELDKSGQLEVESFRPNRADNNSSRKYLVPTDEGFRHALTSTKKRFELHVDEVEVPSPETDGDSESEPENESLSRSKKLYRDVARLESNVEHEATVQNLLMRGNVDWDDPEELVSKLAVLEYRDRIEQDEDGVYQVNGGDGE